MVSDRLTQLELHVKCYFAQLGLGLRNGVSLSVGRFFFLRASSSKASSSRMRGYSFVRTGKNINPLSGAFLKKMPNFCANKSLVANFSPT